MADVLVKPAFQSTVPDTGDTTKLGPNAWNAARQFTGGTDGDVVVRDPASSTGASWVPRTVTVDGDGYVVVSGSIPFKFVEQPDGSLSVYVKHSTLGEFEIVSVIP